MPTREMDKPSPAGPNAIVRWLESEAIKSPDDKSVVDGLIARFVAYGIPIARGTTGVQLLHPLVQSSSVLWRDGEETIERQYFATEQTTQAYRNSPIAIVYEQHREVRFTITDEPREQEFSIVPELRDAGIRDYVALPLPFSDGTVNVVTFATRRKAGFSDDEITLFRDISPRLAIILELIALRRKARTLLDTYVGPFAGARVLSGDIRRGDGEAIEAVIWFSDIRNFTATSNALPADELLAMLNRYFGLMTRTIDEGGGEVLKFIGDSVLGIFSITDGDRETAVKAACEAAIQAVTALDGVEFAGMDAGVALHIGDVFYGNVGGPERLDFTVIGPAVNLASRIEGLTGTTGNRLLVSDAVRAVLPARFRPVGSYQVKGFDREISVHAPT